MKRWANVAAALFTLELILVVSHARAQECLGGRVSVHGYCCWPGQHWARDLGRCDGPPTCPAGMLGEGASCVEAPVHGSDSPEAARAIQEARASAPVATASASAPTVQVAWPRAPADGPLGMHNPESARVTDDGLLIAGAVLFGLGYLESVVIGALTAQHREFMGPADYTCFDTVGALHFVPWIGGVLAGVAQATCGWPRPEETFLWMGIPGVALQITSLAMVIVGMHGHERARPRTRPATSGGAFDFSLNVPGADLGGLSVQTRF